MSEGAFMPAPGTMMARTLELALAGKRPGEIAREMGRSKGAVSITLTTMRRRGLAIPKVDHGRRRPPKVPLTPEREARVLALLRSKTPRKAIAEAVGVSFSTLVKWLTDMKVRGIDVARARPAVRPGSRAGRVLELIGAGKTIPEIMELLNCTNNQVHDTLSALRRKGVAIPAIAPVPRAPRREVSEDEAATVRRMVAEGVAHAEIARRLGISHSRVSVIKKVAGVARPRERGYCSSVDGPPARRTPMPATIHATCEQVGEYARAEKLPWRRTAQDLRAINLLRHENGLGPFLVNWRELVA